MNKKLLALFFLFSVRFVFSDVLYITQYYSNTIIAYNIDESSGQLSPLDIGSVTTGQYPWDLANTNDNKYLYVASGGEPDVYQYSIGESKGAVKSLTKDDLIVANLTYTDLVDAYSLHSWLSPAATGMLPWSTKIDPTGNYAYTGDTQQNTISEFKIDHETGQLVPFATPPVSIDSPAGIGFNPSGSPYAYVANNYENTISLFQYESSTGVLTFTGKTIATDVAPRGVWFDNANHAYVVNGTMSGPGAKCPNTISMYSVSESDGMLIPQNPPTIATGQCPITISIVDETSGTYVYVGNNGSNTISMYQIESNGLLQPLQPATIATGVSPRSMAVYNNKFLYITDISSNTISMYSINQANGQLTALSPASVPAGFAPYIADVVGRVTK